MKPFPGDHRWEDTSVVPVESGACVNFRSWSCQKSHNSVDIRTRILSGCMGSFEMTWRCLQKTYAAQTPSAKASSGGEADETRNLEAVVIRRCAEREPCSRHELRVAHPGG